MAITQANRLMSISTPLGEDVLLINKLRATEGISELFKFEIEMLHEESEAGAEPTIVDIRKILGESVAVSVIARDGVSRNFCGIVSNFSQGNRDKRFSYYYATIVPHVWLLTQSIQTKIFQHISVPDILKQVFEGFDVKWEISGDFKPRNYCVQYRESDFDFASRLMEEEGIYYYFSHDSGDKMIVANTPQSHRDCPGKAEVPFVTELTTDDEFIGSINEWLTDYRLQTGKVTLWDYNFQLPTNKLDVQQPSRFNVGGNQTLEMFEFQAGYARKYDGIDKTGGVNAGDLQNIFSEKQASAEIMMQALDSQYKTGTGIGDCPSLIAGYRFKLINHPYAAQNGQYVLTKVSHDCEQSPSYLSDHINSSAYQNQFTCIAHGSGMAPFRPVPKTPQPIMRGSVTATVVGPAGEEIFTDKYGRVKVQFHWDRDGKNDADSSCWIRVAKDSAGNKWGTMYIPRVGQEVIVDFIEGDPDQPIITGSVYNPETMPHYELPKYKTLSYIKTRTSPDDGKGFNELRFEDKAAKEQVFIRSQKRMDVRARGSLYETCGGNRQEVIGVRSDNNPGGNLAITVGGNYDLHVKDSMYIGIDGKLNEAVKGDVVEDYQSNLSTLVKTKSELNALEITLEAKTKISLKVGGNCIMIDQSGITIAGTMVKINSGGFASGTGNPSIDDPLDAETADTGEPGYLDRPRRGGGRTRNRRTLNSQHYIAPARPGEDARITAMRGTLANSEQGRHALEVYDRYGVTSSFRPGEGSTYDGGANNMNLNPAEDPTTSALTFVHEMNHAEAGNEHTTGDAANQSRGDFVNTMVNEETEGTVRSIEARNELAQSGTDVSNSHFPLENQYQQAHDQAIADARAANPNMSDAEAEQIGRDAGRQRVRQGFDNGEVVTSNNNQPYPQYYGNSWDGQQPTP